MLLVLLSKLVCTAHLSHRNCLSSSTFISTASPMCLQRIFLRSLGSGNGLCLRFSVTLVLSNELEEQHSISLRCRGTYQNMPTLSTSIPQISLLKDWDVISTLRTCPTAILAWGDRCCRRKVDPVVGWIMNQA